MNQQARVVTAFTTPETNQASFQRRLRTASVFSTGRFFTGLTFLH